MYPKYIEAFVLNAANTIVVDDRRPASSRTLGVSGVEAVAAHVLSMLHGVLFDVW